jgi:hypothetical protein
LDSQGKPDPLPQGQPILLKYQGPFSAGTLAAKSSVFEQTTK